MDPFQPIPEAESIMSSVFHSPPPSPAPAHSNHAAVSGLPPFQPLAQHAQVHAEGDGIDEDDGQPLVLHGGNGPALDSDGRLLLMAARHGIADLVQSQINANVALQMQQTALVHAIRHGHQDVVDILLAAGAGAPVQAYDQGDADMEEDELDGSAVGSAYASDAEERIAEWMFPSVTPSGADHWPLWLE